MPQDCSELDIDNARDLAAYNQLGSIDDNLNMEGGSEMSNDRDKQMDSSNLDVNHC